MNDPTIAMFADDATYPYLVESGNVNQDPGYMSSIDQAVLHGGGEVSNDIGLVEYFKQIRGGTAATDIWGYKMTQVSGAENWTPTWPLPETAYIETAVDDDNHAGISPVTFELLQNYPNPFNPTTSITYRIAEITDVKLSIYNLRGQVVRVLVDQRKDAGSYNAVWDGRDQLGRAVASGIYMYKLDAGGMVQSRKMLLMK